MAVRKLTVLLLTIIMIFTIAACGKAVTPAATDTPAVTSTPASAATDTPAATGTPAPAKIADVVINVNGADNVAGSGTVSNQIKEREKTVKSTDTKAALYPMEVSRAANKLMTDQGYNLIQEDWGWSEPLVQKQTAAFIAKQTPDVITGETQSPGYAAQGLLEPFPDALAAMVRESVVAAAWKPMEYKGKIYGVAFQPGVSVLFWNKKLFKEAGLDPEKGPTTWEEMLTMAKKISDVGKGKFWGSLIYSGPNNGGYLRAGIYPLINGGGFVDANNNPIFNSEKNIAAFQWLRDLNATAPKGAMANIGEAAYWDPVNKGLVGIWAEGPWMIQSCKDLKMDCGMGPLPLSKDGKPANITIGAAFASVPIYAKNKEGGFKFIEAMLSKEVQQVIADASVRTPVIKAIGESDAYKKDHADLYQFYQAMQGNISGLPTFNKDNTKAWQVYGEALVKTLMTTQDVKAILDDAQTRVEQVVK